MRTGPAAFPDITDYPKHESCLNCHRQQFFRGPTPAICSVCHTNPSPRDSSRHPFPNPREIFDASPKGKLAASDFEISFPHAKHIEIVTAAGGARSAFRNASFSVRTVAEESCVLCHTTLQPQGTSDVEYVTKPPTKIGDGFWLKKGTFKSVPTGHTACFTCHSLDSGIAPAPSDCATCHKPKQPAPVADFDGKLAAELSISDRITLDAWRRRDSSGTFRHEFQSHAELSCDTCHNVQTLNTTDPKTKRVGISSCSMCHVTATADDGGALNFEVQSRKTNPAFQCAKCHVVFGKQPIPQSHIQAIVEAGGKP
ncbi:MAG: cytochrome c3 family protein [Acidobacteriota bacterium]